MGLSDKAVIAYLMLTSFPIFFRRWLRVFQDVTDRMACSTLVSILDEHFAPTRHRELAWSAVLSVFVLSGQLALHCQESGMSDILPQIQECMGSYVERVICPEIRDRGGWVSVKVPKYFIIKKVCCWSLLLLSAGILYLVWKRRKS
uniref:Bcl-2 Bcl-2 homology region 1-3 domain-containing protein n=1 Tax=Cyprinus carpio carpio TaxID=630221 RepID=A0A9J7ZK94_CYPCA